MIPVLCALFIYFLCLIYSFKTPGYLFPIVLFLYPFKQFAQVAIPSLVDKYFWVYDAGILFCCAAVIYRKGNFKNTLTRFSKQTVICFLLYIYFYISMVWSGYENSWFNVIETTFDFILYIILLPNVFNGEKDMADALDGIVFMGACLMVLLVCSRSLYADVGRISLNLAANGTARTDTNPLAIAGAAVTMMFVATYATEFSGVMRALLFATAFYVTFFSGRGELIFGAIVIILRVVQTGRLPKRTWLIGGLLSLATLLAIHFVPDSYWSRWAFSGNGIGSLQSGAEVRFENIRVTLTAYWETPSLWLFGLGGNWCYGAIGGYPHNNIDQALVETGLIGLSMLVYFYYIPFSHFWRNQTGFRSSKANRFFVLVGMLFLYNILNALKTGALLAPQLFMLGVVLERVRAYRIRFDGGVMENSMSWKKLGA